LLEAKKVYLLIPGLTGFNLLCMQEFYGINQIIVQSDAINNASTPHLALLTVYTTAIHQTMNVNQ